MREEVDAVLLSIFFDDPFPLTLLGALQDGFAQPFVSCDVAKPEEFPSLRSGQQRFLSTCPSLHLFSYVLVGSVFSVRDTQDLTIAFVFECLDCLTLTSTLKSMGHK